MPVPCPCCRAVNDVGPACRRCKADLSLLFAVAGRRDALVADARRLVRAGQYPEAVQALDAAASLRGGDDVRRLRAAVGVLTRDFSAAWMWYSAAKHSGDRRGGA